MNIKAILKKVTTGESLTDEEKTFLDGYDPDSTAAAARKGAEAKAKAEAEKAIQLQARIDEIEAKLLDSENGTKSEAEKLKMQLAKLEKQAQDAQKKADEAEGRLRETVRGSHIDRLFGTMKIVDGVDRDAVRSIFAQGLKDLQDDDLSTDAALERVKAFAEKNPALMLDTSGHGSGVKKSAVVQTAGKQITRGQFEGMAMHDRTAFVAGGGIVKEV
jgi:small-conductance mechanosensitive channel